MKVKDIAAKNRKVEAKASNPEFHSSDTKKLKKSSSEQDRIGIAKTAYTLVLP